MYSCCGTVEPKEEHNVLWALSYRFLKTLYLDIFIYIHTLFYIHTYLWDECMKSLINVQMYIYFTFNIYNYYIQL